MNRIEEQVNKFYIAVDESDWQTVKSIFADSLELDYSSMSGQPAAYLKAEDIVESWKALLPGFAYTHHQIGNMVTLENGDQASVFCYGTASHYLENEGGNLWLVVGSYDLDLQQIGGNWRITKLKFNFKFQDGNLSLPQAAMGALK